MPDFTALVMTYNQYGGEHSNGDQAAQQGQERMQENYIRFVQSLERWLESMLKYGEQEPGIAIKHIQRAFEGNLVANVQYHHDMKSSLILPSESSGSSAAPAAAFHGFMALAYESLSRQDLRATNELVTENNAILKTNRKMIAEIKDLLRSK